jgi:hypothetical protein
VNFDAPQSSRSASRAPSRAALAFSDSPDAADGNDADPPDGQLAFMSQTQAPLPANVRLRRAGGGAGGGAGAGAGAGAGGAFMSFDGASQDDSVFIEFSQAGGAGAGDAPWGDGSSAGGVLAPLPPAAPVKRASSSGGGGGGGGGGRNAKLRHFINVIPPPTANPFVVDIPRRVKPKVMPQLKLDGPISHYLRSFQELSMLGAVRALAPREAARISALPKFRLRVPRRSQNSFGRAHPPLRPPPNPHPKGSLLHRFPRAQPARRVRLRREETH